MVFLPPPVLPLTAAALTLLALREPEALRRPFAWTVPLAAPEFAAAATGTLTLPFPLLLLLAMLAEALLLLLLLVLLAVSTRTAGPAALELLLAMPTLAALLLGETGFTG